MGVMTVSGIPLNPPAWFRSSAWAWPSTSSSVGRFGADEPTPISACYTP